MNDHVTFSIKLKPCKEVGDPILVDFTITNTSNQDLMILKRNTPLGEITNDVFKITRGPYRIPYDGIMIKSGAPSENDYLKLRSGETVTSTTEITKHYGINEAGDYNIALEKRRIHAIAMSKGSQADLSRDHLSAHNSFDLETPSIPFILAKGNGEPQKTLGRKARKNSRGNSLLSQDDFINMLDKEMSSTAIPKAAKDPHFMGGTQEQQNIVKKAHKQGFDELCACIQELRLNTDINNPLPLFTTWFGDYSSSMPGRRFAVVFGCLVLIRNAMQNDVITYELEPENTAVDDGVYAWTHKGSLTVFMWKAFWEAKESGEHDTKAGVVIHELSHAIAHTDDFEYSLNEVMNLAKTNPSEAIQNAENYEYCVEAYAMEKIEEKAKQDEIARQALEERRNRMNNPNSYEGLSPAPQPAPKPSDILPVRRTDMYGRTRTVLPNGLFAPLTPSEQLNHQNNNHFNHRDVIPQRDGTTIDQYGRIIDPNDPIMHPKNNDWRDIFG